MDSEENSDYQNHGADKSWRLTESKGVEGELHTGGGWSSSPSLLACW
jgi:hypothetical protein